jgi:hypothetical protein
VEESLPVPDLGEQEDPRLNAEIQLKLPRKTPVLDDPSTYAALPTLPDLLAAISDQTPQLSFISDASLADLKPPTKSGKMFAIIHASATQAKARWQFDPRGYVVVRSRFVYRNRPQSIPATLLRRIAESAQRTGEVSLLDHARLAAALTNEQRKSLVVRFGYMPFTWPKISTQALFNWAEELRILASLSGNELRTLERGVLLPVQALSPLTQAAVVRAVEKRSVQNDQAPIEPVETALLPKLALRLRTNPAERQADNSLVQTYEFQALVPDQEPVLSATIEITRAEPAKAPPPSSE